MSVDRAVIESIVAGAIAELNLQRSADDQLADAAEAPLFCPGGPLDSLGLVLLISELENGVENAYGRRINLADDALLAAEGAPFASVGTLRDYLAEIV